MDDILLIAAAGPSPVNQSSRLIEAGSPDVSLDRIPERIQVDSVCVDDLGAAAIGVEHLTTRGYRRIGLVTGTLLLKNERHRVLGYILAMERAGIAPDGALIWHGSLRVDKVAELCLGRLKSRSVFRHPRFCPGESRRTHRAGNSIPSAYRPH